MSKGIELAQRVKEAVDNMNATVKEVRQDFEAFIVDKGIPLDERWQVWVNAPVALKDTQSYYVNFTSLPKDAVMYEGAVYHAERHETVDTVAILEVLQEWQDLVNDGEPPADNWEHKYWRKAVDFYDVYSLEAFKEEILSLNLVSFTYDW